MEDKVFGVLLTSNTLLSAAASNLKVNPSNFSSNAKKQDLTLCPLLTVSQKAFKRSVILGIVSVAKEA